MGYIYRTQGPEGILRNLARFAWHNPDVAPSMGKEHPLHRQCYRLEKLLYEATEAILASSGLNTSNVPHPTPGIELSEVSVRPEPTGNFGVNLMTYPTGYRRLSMVLRMELHPKQLADSKEIEENLPAIAAHEIGHALFPIDALGAAVNCQWREFTILLPHNRGIHIPRLDMADPGILEITPRSEYHETLAALRVFFRILEELTADMIGFELLPPGPEKERVAASFDKMAKLFLKESAKEPVPLYPAEQLMNQVRHIGAVKLFCPGQQVEIPASLYPPENRANIDALVEFYVGQMRGIKNRATVV